MNWIEVAGFVTGAASVWLAAFVPNDLPDHVELPGTTWPAVSDAPAALGRWTQQPA